MLRLPPAARAPAAQGQAHWAAAPVLAGGDASVFDPAGARPGPGADAGGPLALDFEPESAADSDSADRDNNSSDSDSDSPAGQGSGWPGGSDPENGDQTDEDDFVWRAALAIIFTINTKLCKIVQNLTRI